MRRMQPLTYPKLKDDLIQQNLSNIAKQDPRLAEAVKGSGTTNPNFSVGMGTAADADRLGKVWVGDGGKSKEMPWLLGQCRWLPYLPATGS